ncbi:alpha/beta hydrolase family protein [Abyssalbus ytuae]|uniref:Alpha/beta fold hydrolase n=1 Tax=Abyssalbus ytuae TaxID=2926907 RepID=A0A9E6ZKV6_9FLAO|nr:alpha/beta fold hydrolase [Abyssalbus ytuae]UOB16459.1 alpha/beta fold hydrolase [Abyssalbus ytuae]
MKKKVLIILMTIFSFSLFGQDITGQWQGLLKVQGIQLRLVFNVTKTDNGYNSTMDSPDQGAKGIPVTNTIFENNKVTFQITNAKIEYTGELKEDEIIGTFKQAGQEFPMNLSQKAIEKEVLNRPQEPTKPYPYYSEDITFQNLKDNISLSGTLTLPKKEGNFPVVILISGSGPQNRDEELFGHKPFLVISDYLTKNEIGVLRYDDRGVGQSTGDFKNATTANFATDAESAITYLKTRKEINKKKIGLIGHSEGGIIASIVASKSKDISFIVLLAGTGIKGDKVLLLQQELISKAKGIAQNDIKKSLETNAKLFEIIDKSNDNQKLKTDLSNLIDETLKSDTNAQIPNGFTKKEFILMQVNQLSTPWLQYFIKFNPGKVLEKVKCPVLAVSGEKDLQVPPKENLTAISDALKKGGNKKVTTKVFPNLNHLFQESETGLPSEYATIEQTVSPDLLTEITTWILNQVN